MMQALKVTPFSKNLHLKAADSLWGVLALTETFMRLFFKTKSPLSRMEAENHQRLVCFCPLVFRRSSCQIYTVYRSLGPSKQMQGQGGFLR